MLYNRFSYFFEKYRLNILGVFFYVVIFFTLLIRLINLNYNSPFNDEAIYVVVGNMEIFRQEIQDFAPASWMAGSPLIYPILTALTYQWGGITASRFLNVLFGILAIEEIYIFTYLVGLHQKKAHRKAAGLVAIVVAGFSSVGLYVSRLATYDMPSFFLFILGINEFLKGRYFTSGKHYFIGAVSLFLAFVTKITVSLLFPPLALVSFLLIYKKSLEQKKLWLMYFFIPLVLSSAAYVFFNINNFLAFMHNQVLVENTERSELFVYIWDNISFLLIFTVLSVLVLIYKHKVKETVLLVILGSILPVLHLFINREATLNKHLFVSVIFWAPLIGYAFVYLFKFKKRIHKIVSLLMALMLLLYVSNFRFAADLEQEWSNTEKVDQYLRERVKSEHKILTEVGASTTLALYEKTSAANVVTFDWFEYEDITDDQSYIYAIRDEYFDFIELDGSFFYKPDLDALIKKELEGRYKLGFKEGDFEVYEKIE